MSRILLYTGKGGVGKTTIAGATAIHAADMGYRTLVMSSDPAHSLEDAFDRELGPEPVQVSSNLWAQEVDVYYSLKKHWGKLRDYILQVFEWQQVDEIMAEELAALPGMEEAAAFLWVEQFYTEEDYDLIIIDSAPTGETLKLLSLPEVGRWWMERIFPIQRKVAKRIGPMIRAMSEMPVPEEETYENVEDLYTKLLKTHQLLSDPETSAVRLVVNPERMVIQEARRAFTYLQLYGYPVDNVVVNRILPEDTSDPFFERYIEAQKKYLDEIETIFEDLPILKVPHLGEEAFGIDLLRHLGEKLYGEKDPTETYHTEPVFDLQSQNGSYLLQLRLPYASQEDVSVMQYGEELVVQIKNQRRNFFLPQFLAYYNASGAKLEDGWLRVRFEKDDAAEE